MPNLSDLNVYLKSASLAEGDILEFANAGNITEKDFSKTKDGSDIKRVFEIKVYTSDGKEKLLSMNKTCQRSLSDAWGENTDAWVGKKAKVSFIEQLAFGRINKVLVLRPV